MASGYENRRFTRSAVEVPVTLDFGRGDVTRAQVVNLSLVGMYVEAVDSAPVYSECKVSLTPAPPKDAVFLRGRVMHRDPSGMGMEITGIDSGSFDTLRILIVEGAGNAFAIEEEMVAKMALIPPLY